MKGEDTTHPKMWDLLSDLHVADIGVHLTKSLSLPFVHVGGSPIAVEPLHEMAPGFPCIEWEGFYFRAP
jgi:hypothetical protein